MIRISSLIALLGLGLLVTITGCGGESKPTAEVNIDGSSTVAPITQAIAEDFGKVHSNVKLAVGMSGTGGGFKKFDDNQTDINNASRPIRQTEADTAKTNGVEYIELPIAFDGLTVVINPKNDWVDHLTVAELKALWEPASPIKTWKQIRPTWPDTEIKLYGPGADSGTFDYFTEAIMGKAGASRQDFTATEDDNLTVQGVAGDVGALGFFGFAYFLENKATLKAVAIDNGKGPVMPTLESINANTYAPLSRPIFIYVNRKSADRPEVRDFVSYYLQNASAISTEVGYVPLPDTAYKLAQERFSRLETGSAFLGLHVVGMTIEEILKLEASSHTGS